MGLWCLISLLQVDVGNFLRLKSCVLYTELENLEQPLINVEVVAHVTRPECRSSEVSINLFFFVSKAVQQFSDCVAQQSLWEGHLRIIWNILLPLFLSHKFVRRTSPILLDLFFLTSFCVCILFVFFEILSDARNIFWINNPSRWEEPKK